MRPSTHYYSSEPRCPCSDPDSFRFSSSLEPIVSAEQLLEDDVAEVDDVELVEGVDAVTCLP